MSIIKHLILLSCCLAIFLSNHNVKVIAQGETEATGAEVGIPSSLLEGALIGDIEMIEKAITGGESIDTVNG